MRFLPHLSRPLTVVLVAACTSANSGSSPQPSSGVVRVLSATGTASANLNGNDGISERKVAGPPDQVFRSLRGVLDSLGIPVNTLDPAKRTIGNTGFNTRAKLKGVSLSRYIDCGTTQMGPSADSYSINLEFIVEVRPDAGGSSLVTTLQAMGKPLNYAQDYSACSSKGNLENKVAELVTAKLAR